MNYGSADGVPCFVQTCPECFSLPFLVRLIVVAFVLVPLVVVVVVLHREL